MESSVELNRDILFPNWTPTPFVRATARYYTQRLVEQVSTIDDNVLYAGKASCVAACGRNSGRNSSCRYRVAISRSGPREWTPGRCEQS